MKSSRALWFLVLMCVLSGFAFADGLPADPAIEINDPICDSSTPCAPLVNSLVPFTFSADANGNGSIFFEVNPSGPAFTDLNVQTLGIFASTTDVVCRSNVFQCDVTFIGGVTNMFFHPFPCEIECGASSFPPGDVINILLGDNTGIPNERWTPNQSFTAIANLGSAATTSFISTPEPSSLLLFGTGAVFAMRRKLKFRKN